MRGWVCDRRDRFVAGFVRIRGKHPPYLAAKCRRATFNGMKDKIRQWFEQPGVWDGDFFIARRTDSYDVIPPAWDMDAVIYCTKKHCIGQLVRSLEGRTNFGAVSRYGLTSEGDMEWLRSFVGSRRLLFWGDADPADLLHYAWLREELSIEYAGMSDRLLAECRTALADHMIINFRDDSERAALPLVRECLGDLAELLGPLCAGLLETGRKIEMEALLSCKQCTPQEMESALLFRS